MGNSAKLIAVISLIVVGITSMSAFGESNYHDLIAIKSVKKISGDVSDFAVIEVRLFNTATTSINVNPDYIHLKNSANEYFSLSLENISGLFSDCLTSETTVPKSISKEFFLCFEVPKDPNEDYILVIDKDKTVLDSPLEFRIYLSSHNINPDDYDMFDVSSVYFTVHGVEEKQLDKQKIFVVNFTAFNGYGKLDKYGDTTTVSLPIAGRNIFLSNSEGEVYQSLSTDYGGASYHKYCPKIKDIRTNQFGDITLCFDITQASKAKDIEYWLVFNDSPSSYACPGACQEKKWELSPFMEDINTSPMVKPPSFNAVKPTLISPEDGKIPSWVKNTFLWYGQGLISEDEIIAAIQFMIKEGIIKI